MQNNEDYLRVHPTILSGSSDCSKCFYGLQLDTYQNGCTHDCHYCWAKAELTPRGQWNNPRPTPISIEYLRDLFFTVFETNRPSHLRPILERRVPLRLGSMSDPFLAMEKKYNVTYEILKILDFYKYPCLILTRSDLVAEDKYIEVLNPQRTTVQFSIPSLNPNLVSILEPKAPAPSLRLNALKKLMDAGVWTTVRLNPLFPIHPDGFYSEMKHSGSHGTFNFFELPMVDEIAASGCKGILAGFAHLNSETLKYLHERTGTNLRDFMKQEIKETTTGLKYSAREIRAYYEVIAQRCKKSGMEFSTCYLGLGESFFWKDQDLWADKKDCCNIKNHVEAFKTDTNMIPMTDRLRLARPQESKWKILIASFYYRLWGLFIKNIWKK